MGFLKKIGIGLLKGFELWTGFSVTARKVFPNAAGTFDIVDSDFAKIADVVVQAEAMGQVLGLSGADKLRGVVPSVAQIILVSDLLAKHKIKDEALFTQGVTKVADGVADILNSLEDK